MHVLYLLWNPIMLYYTFCSYFQLVIFIFILTFVFISSLIWGSFIYDFYLCVYIYVIFVCIFYSVTGHHGRTVWLNDPPCINIFEIKKINEKNVLLKKPLSPKAEILYFGIADVSKANCDLIGSCCCFYLFIHSFIYSYLTHLTWKCPTYSISQEICTRFLLCCALLWLYISWFSHIHQAYFTGTVAI